MCVPSLPAFAETATGETTSRNITFYNWDFEASLADSVEGLEFMTGNSAATDIVTNNGESYARVPLTKPAVTYVKTLYDALYTTKTVRYVVLEFDFKKDFTSKAAPFHTRGKITNNRSAISFSVWPVTSWTHYRLVFDTSNDVNSSYAVKVYKRNTNGTYTMTETASEVRDIYDIRLNSTDISGYVYFDNFTVSGYSDEYQAFNPHDMADPMHTSDEALFGVWDSAASSWSTLPMLRYSSFPGLSEVEAAAKNGDYETASEKLLEYYKTKSGDDILTYSANAAKDIKAEAMLDKIWTYADNSKLLASAEIGTDWSWHSIDLTGMSGCTNGTYYIMDADMDGSSLEIASKENPDSKAAYVEVTSGGVITTYPVTADTYISPMANAAVNFGSESYLYSQEDAEDTQTPFSANTKRAYLKFNFPAGISTNSTVKLCIYARSTGTKSKKVYVLSTQNERNFDESTLTWDKHYPQAFCFKETGFIWESVTTCDQKWKTEYEWINYSTRLYQPSWLLSRYLATDNEDYALCALEVAMSQYTQMPDALYPRALEGGWRTENLIKTIYTGLSSEYMSAKVFKSLLKWVYDHGAALKDTTIPTTNQDSAVKVNFARICAYFPEISPENWWQTAKDNLNNFYTNKLLNSDGSYTEACTNYISGVIDEFIEALKLVGIRDGKDNEYYLLFKDKLGQLVTYYANLPYPGVGMVPYGDGGRGGGLGVVKRANEYLDDSELQYIASSGMEGTPPSYTTRLYPAKSVVMFKSGWGQRDLGAFLNNDGGGSHGHFDDLALDVSAYGKYLLVDAGVSSYSEGSEFAANRNKTIYHNTIEIDNKNQVFSGANTPGGMNLKTNKTFDYLRSDSDNKMYPGFDVNRNVMMIKNRFIIVSDSIVPSDSEPHTYRQSWHPDYNTGLTLDSETHEARTNLASQPNIRMIPASNGESAKLFDRMMASPTHGEVISKSVQYYRENVTGTQTFDTVLYPEGENQNTDITVTRINLDVANSEATSFKIDIDGNTGYYYALNEGALKAQTFEAFEADGEMAYVETSSDGTPAYIALANTKTVKKDGEILVSFVSAPESFSAEFGERELWLYADGGLPEGGVRIATDVKYKNVYLNGEAVASEYSGGILTTDGSPYVEEEKESLIHQYYYWDFEGENGLQDKLRRKTFVTRDTAHAVPVLYTENSDSVAKIAWEPTDTAFVLDTSSLFGKSNSEFYTDADNRYAVFEMDFKKDITEGNVTFALRDTRNQGMFMYGTGAVDWTKLVMIADMKNITNGNVPTYVVKYENGVYTPIIKADLSLTSVSEFRILTSATKTGSNFYLDDFGVGALKSLCSQISSLEYAQDVEELINTYASYGVITLPEEYTCLLYDDKLDVIEKLVGKTFESDEAVVEAISAALPGSDGSKLYYSWDFENGTLNDYVCAEPFMMDHPDDKVQNRVVNSVNPTNPLQKSAKIDFALSNKERLVFTDELNSDFASGSVKYVVYTIDAYLPTRQTFSFRLSNGAKATHPISNYIDAEKWHKFMIVADTANSQIIAYNMVNGSWNTFRTTSDIPVMDFARFSIMSGTGYYDNVTVKGFASLYEEVNEASEENVVSVLKAFDTMNIIEFTDAYNLLTDSQKQKLVRRVKSKTYTSDAELMSVLRLALSGTTEVVYYDWDFENGTLNDNIKSEPFMLDHPEDKAEDRVAFAQDPLDVSNSVAKIDHSTSSLERLVFSPDINDDFASSMFGYVTYECKVYAPQTVRLNLRISSVPTDHHVFSGYIEGGKWHSIKAIADLDSKTVKGYKLVGGKWELIHQESNINEFEFNRFSIFLYGTGGNTTPVAYFDDFKVTSHVSLCESVNEATSETIAEVLEHYSSIGAIDISSDYYTFSSEQKAAFTSHIKSKTYADSYEVNKEVILYFTNEDVVIWGKSYVDNKLDWIKFIVADSGINAEKATAVVASYCGHELADVEFVECDGPIARGNDYELSGLGIDVSGDVNVKFMLLSDLENAIPLSKSKLLK